MLCSFEYILSLSLHYYFVCMFWNVLSSIHHLSRLTIETENTILIRYKTLNTATVKYINKST